ncbi:MAG: PVC-type heme-binding CxxCH protein, partial [Pirellulales bacterium]
MSKISLVIVTCEFAILSFALQPSPTAAPQPAVDGALKSASPKSPQDAQAGIQVPAGFRVDLVAVEPQVLDPVAFAWGPDGRLWVAEMADYPLGKGAKGRVRCLKDTNGDGRYNHGTVFLDGLNFPTSVLPWRDGVLVTAAPQIIFARDTNGDGRADQQHVLFQGFGEGNQQHRVNGLCFTLDNWVAVANGDSGGTIGSTKTGLNVEISGRDLLIQPDTGGLIPRSGMSQFGHTRDDWGNWFGCNNPNPIYHFVLEDKYLLRNPYLKPPSPRREIIVGRRRVVPLSEVINHCSVRQGYPGRISSACGVTIYRDELLCSEYLNNSFTAEPYHNLVHRRVLKSEGVTFASHRAENEREAEFFRSDDPWCRPTYVQTGPDGALYIADMYRQVIEHPEWIDDQLEKKLDLGAGRDRGRIWRVAPAGSKPRPFPRLDRMSNSQLVASLDSPGAWQRDMAQQMIVWQADKAAIKPLLDLIGSCKRPQARLQAMYALEGLRALPDKVVVTLLSDTHPGVRRHAIRVAEVRLADTPSFGPALLKLINDHDPHVRLQLAYSLGAWDDERAAKALAQLAVRNQSDPYLTAAVFSSLNQSNIAGVLAAVLHGANGEATGELLAAFYGQVAALADRSLLDDAIGEISRPRGGNKILAWQLVALADVLDRLVSRTIELRTLASPPIRLQVNAVFDEARRIVGDHAAGAQDVLSAMRLLRHSGATRTGAALTSDLALLRQRVSPQQTIAIQLAAVDALGRVDGPSIPGLLLEGWSGQTPQIRRAI